MEYSGYCRSVNSGGALFLHGHSSHVRLLQINIDIVYTLAIYLDMIIWEEKKNKKLKLERNINFEEICDIILNHRYLDIIEHPKRRNQNIFVIEINNYVHAVPFVIDENENIVLKTAFPSRKLDRKYRGEK